MAEARSPEIPPGVVERRLRELAELHDLGLALRDVRFVDPQHPDRVRERPDPSEQESTRGVEEPRDP